jgi:hypothetical protein
MRYVALTERRLNGDSFVVDTLRDNRRIKVKTIEEAYELAKKLNEGWGTWEEACTSVNEIAPQDPFLQLLDQIKRLTEIVADISDRQTILIRELKHAQEKVVKLEYITYGEPDGFKAKTMDKLLNEVMKKCRGI